MPHRRVGVAEMDHASGQGALDQPPLANLQRTLCCWGDRWPGVSQNPTLAPVKGQVSVSSVSASPGRAPAPGLEKEEGLLISSALPAPWGPHIQPKALARGWTPTAWGPVTASRGWERCCLRHQGPTRLWLEMPVATGPFPQGGLRVTHCYAEEDTQAGPGPGWAGLVSLLGSQPLRQVQETGRQGAAKQDPGRSPDMAPLGPGRWESSQMGSEAGTGRRWGQGWPPSGFS